jgi:hypothetical protein
MLRGNDDLITGLTDFRRTSRQDNVGVEGVR